MIEIKVLKTKEDYKNALNAVADLMAQDPDPESKEGEQLLLLTTLISDYESKAFPLNFPDPIDAIKFRMEQADLKAADLVQYIGSKGRVSEILSGKRQLTLDMVRALESGLGIPAKVLIQKPDQNKESQYQHWDTNLVKTMEERGYFGNMSLKKYDQSTLLVKFLSVFGGNAQSVALLRKTSFRTEVRTDRNALLAWKIRVLEKAKKIKAPKYKHGVVDLSFMQNLIKLSVKKDGPVLAQEYLKERGIKLVIEPHLPKTHLDGAAIFTEKDSPVIGLTIRHDRLSNFWFTLMHELAHVGRHYKQDVELFYDEKLQDKDGIEIDEKEKEADEWAGESILPESKWAISNARITPSPMAAQSLADELGIHVAVVAGIISFRHQNFFYLHKIINDDSAKVKKLFADAFKIKAKI